MNIEVNRHAAEIPNRYRAINSTTINQILLKMIRKIFLLTVAIPLITISCNPKEQNETVEQQQKNETTSVENQSSDLTSISEQTEVQEEPVDYEIVSTESNSMKALGNKPLSEYSSQEIEALPTAKRMSYRVLVPSDINENQVRPTVEKIVADISSSDNEIDSIHLLLYSDRELIDGTYDVAMATWAPGGQVGNITPEIARSNNRAGYSISLTIKQDLEEYLRTRAESEDKFDFTEAERRQIFKEIVAAEDRAWAEADELYPPQTLENMDKNMDKMRELEEFYKSQVREKYGISEEIMTDITIEGVSKRWPMD